MRNIILAIVLLLFLCGPNKSYSQLWKQYTDSAQQIDQKDVGKILELYYKAKSELRKDSNLTASNAFISTSIAIVYMSMGKNDSAEAYFLEAMDIREKVLDKKDRQYADSYYNLGTLYLNLGKFEKSGHFLKEAEEIRRVNYGKEDSDYVKSIKSMAVLYQTMGKYDSAEPLFLETRELTKKVSGVETIEYALICNNLGSFYDDLLKDDQAEKEFLEAMSIFEKVSGKNNANYAGCCDNLASIYRHTQQYKKAEHFALEANAIAGKILNKDDPDYAIYRNNLGILYNEIGNYQKAEPLLLEANDIWIRAYGKNSYYVGVTYGNLALLYHDIGETEKAESNYLLAKQIFEINPGRTEPTYAMSCNNLANFYNDMGQYEKAEKLFTEAKMLFEKILGHDNNDYASTCENLANVYYSLGKYDTAELLYHESMLILEKILGKDKPDYAQCCINLANLYVELKEYRKAESLYLEARQIEIDTHGTNYRDYAACCNKLAGLYAEMGNFAKAEILYKASKKTMKKIFGSDHILYAESCNDLANLYWSEQKPLDANMLYTEALRTQNSQVKKMFRFTNEFEKQSYLKKYTELVKDYYSFKMSFPQALDLSYNLALFNRNMVLSSSEKLRYAAYHAADSSIRSRYNEWIGFREQIAFWNAKPVEERPAYMDELLEKANNLEKALTRFSSDFSQLRKQNETTWEMIRKKLKPNEAAIEFVEFEYYNGKRWTDSTYLMALLLKKNQAKPIRIKLFEKKQLDSLLQDNSLNSSITKLYTRGAGIVRNTTSTRSIYSLVWRPMERYLSGINTIYFAPAGSLYRISFAALPMDKHRVLSDKYRLVQLNTTATILDTTERYLNTSDKICLYGGVVYDVDSTSIKNAVANVQIKYAGSRSLPKDLARGDTWNYLPGTKREIEEISSLAAGNDININVKQGIQATEESIKMLNGEYSPAILHIASHGFFFPDPKTAATDKSVNETENGKTFRRSDDPLFRSGLLLAGANNAWKGNPVEGVEDGILTSYEVSNLYLPGTKLVVLSACETGLGDIKGSEGVYGLQRAFKMAGAEYLIMSLWKVPDAETSQFMAAFYESLFAKKSIPVAFYNAQMEMKNKYREDPYKWAAWILVH